MITIAPIQYMFPSKPALLSAVGALLVEVGCSVNVGDGDGVIVAVVTTNTTRYVFQGWNGVGSGAYTGNVTSASVTLNSSITETANWQKQVQITFINTPTRGGAISSKSTTLWEDTGVINITATPKEGYNFVAWNSSSAFVFGNVTAASTTTIITGPGTITETFTPAAIAASTTNYETMSIIGIAVIVVVIVAIAIVLLVKRKKPKADVT